MTFAKKGCGFALAVIATLAGCDEYCLEGWCANALLLTVQLPSERRSYTFTFVTQQGRTTCSIDVPVQLGDCDDSNLVRFGPKEGADSTVAEVAILDSSSAELRVTRGAEEVYAGTIVPEPGSLAPSLGTEDYCGGPCYVTAASLDLRNIGR